VARLALRQRLPSKDPNVALAVNWGLAALVYASAGGILRAAIARGRRRPRRLDASAPRRDDGVTVAWP
jgi:hypothetical protein